MSRIDQTGNCSTGEHREGAIASEAGADCFNLASRILTGFHGHHRARLKFDLLERCDGDDLVVVDIEYRIQLGQLQQVVDLLGQLK